MFPRRLRPGQQYTATELSAMARTVAALDSASGVGGITLSREGGGFVVRDDSTPPIFGKITGAPTGAKYPWSQVYANEDGTFSTVGTEYGIAGTAASVPAVELGGRTDVAVNSIVVLFPLASGAGYGFTWVGTGSTTPLNSQNTDGTEIDATTTDVRFNKTTGSKITQAGGVSTHTLLAASPTQMGAVTTELQSVGGLKYSEPGTDAGTTAGWWVVNGNFLDTTAVGSETVIGSGVTTTVATPHLWQYTSATAFNQIYTAGATLGYTIATSSGSADDLVVEYGIYRSAGGTPTVQLPAVSNGTFCLTKQTVYAGSPLRDNNDTSGTDRTAPRFGVIRTSAGSNTRHHGGDATTGGLTFVGGLYISGSVTAPAVGDITGLGTDVATWLATPSSANLAAAVTDETGTGALVFADTPTLVNPVVGTQAPGDNSTTAASTAYVDDAVATAVAGTTVSLSYDAGTNVLTVTVNGVSDTIDLSDLA